MPETTHFQMKNTDELEILTAYIRHQLAPNMPDLISKSEVHRTAIRLLAWTLKNGNDVNVGALKVSGKQISTMEAHNHS